MPMIFTSESAGYIVLRIIIILALTFIAARLCTAAMKRMVKQDKIHFKLLRNIVLLLIYVVGMLVAMHEIPKFETAFQAILAGSGIAALTIGLAAQESLGNAINGMFISIFKPFEVGDRVRLIGSDIIGYIEDITLRHTVVRTLVNSRVIVPNSVISKELIENSNYWDGKASAFIDVVITYDSDLKLAQNIMSGVITSHADYIDTRPEDDRKGPPAARVYVRNLSLYGVELRASMWTDSIGKNFDACSDAREKIKLEFDKQGIKLAHSSNFDPKLTPMQ